MKIRSGSWRASLPKAEEIAQKVKQEVGQAVIDALASQSEKWMSENKLLHVGAAQKLANELREKLNEGSK